MGPSQTVEPRDSLRDAIEETALWCDATPEQHYRGFADACALAFAALEGQPRREEFLAWQEPLPPESIALIERLGRRRTAP